MKQYSFSVTGSTLKTIAMISMLIDHIAAAIIGPLRGKLPSAANAAYDLNMIFGTIYPYMRKIGRIAFPIYCFLLVEGFVHTRNIRRYIGRMVLFAIISELPFDYALGKSLFALRHNNVYITLLFGLLVMTGISWFEKKRPASEAERLFNLFMQALIAIAGLVAAKYLYCDYGYKGVLLIEVLYALRLDHKLRSILGAVTISWESTAPLAFIPIWFYNGKRGKQMKYFYYCFYPAHLLVLGFLKHTLLHIFQ